MKKSNNVQMIGQKFNRLTVITQVEDYVDSKGKHVKRWLCQCDCGNFVIVRDNHLKNNHTKSCSCLKLEKTIETGRANKIKRKRFNIFDLSGEYGIGYTAKNEQFYFDLEDFDKIKDICWHINKNGYVVARSVEGKTLQMHCLIMETNDSKQVIDHIVTEHKNDNRKQNLRITTQEYNGKNRKKGKNNKSGVTGVHWHKAQQKWVAFISINKKLKHLGYFKNIEDAIKIRKEAEIKYYGEYRYRGEKYEESNTLQSI